MGFLLEALDCLCTKSVIPTLHSVGVITDAVRTQWKLSRFPKEEAKANALYLYMSWLLLLVPIS